MTAINDGILLEMMLYKCLKKYCKGLECYADLVELFHDVTYQTASRTAHRFDHRTDRYRRSEQVHNGGIHAHRDV